VDNHIRCVDQCVTCTLDNSVHVVH
jgi:hypothetical protein